jgi:hypothetical protein
MAENGDGKTVRLTDERLRRLEKRMAGVEQAQHGTNARLDQTNARLDQAVDVLTRLVRVVAAQNDRMNRSFKALDDRLKALSGRLDRFARAIMQGRTADTRRLSQLERHVESPERRV